MFMVFADQGTTWSIHFGAILLPCWSGVPGNTPNSYSYTIRKFGARVGAALGGACRADFKCVCCGGGVWWLGGVVGH